MFEIINVAGEKFGRLKVTNEMEHKNGRVAWWCICDCGNRILVPTKRLRNGMTQSCGCLLQERRGASSLKENRYEIHGDYAIGYTAKGEQFFVDTADLEAVKQYCWHIGKRGYLLAYPRAGRGSKQIIMHQLLKKYDSNLFVIDHIDGNPLNNQQNNLRVCTQKENSRNSGLNKNNTSGYTGVYFCNTKKKWRAVIKVNYKNISLGYHVSKDHAIKARRQGEQKYFGEYARRENVS